jgi:hypothetical protein
MPLPNHSIVDGEYVTVVCLRSFRVLCRSWRSQQPAYGCSLLMLDPSRRIATHHLRLQLKQASVRRKWREDPQARAPPTQEPRLWVDKMESIWRRSVIRTGTIGVVFNGLRMRGLALTISLRGATGALVTSRYSMAAA